jgi:accessory gene regulator B
MSIETIANRIAVSINNNHPESSSVAVLKYALIAVINLIVTMSIVFIIAAITGDVIPAIVAIVAFPVLRYVSGGLHLSSSNMCNILTASFMLIAIYTPNNFWYNGFILNILTIIVLFLCAPSGIKRSKLDKKYYPILKFIAILLVSTNFLLQSHVLSIVFFIQSLTTTKLFQICIELLEAKFIKVGEKG